MTHNPKRHGPSSRVEGLPAIRDEWRMADEMEAEYPNEPGARWVPLDSIWLKADVSPRSVDWGTVDHYKAVFFDLPPIHVQKDTFALIDGRHRYEAGRSKEVTSACIRIREIECDDEELAERAFLANLGHGLPYTTKERTEGLKLLLARHPDWSNGQLVRTLGLSHETVAKYRAQIQRRAEGADQVSENRTPDRRTGADGKSYQVPAQVSENRTPARQPVSTYDPGPEEPTPDDDESAWLAAHRRENAPATVEAAPPAEELAAEDETRGGPVPAADPPENEPEEPFSDDDFGDYATFAFVEGGVRIDANFAVLATTSKTTEMLRKGMTQLIQWATKQVGE